MIIFSAIAPHPPVLIPSIGKENAEKTKDTAEAFEELEQELYAAQPDTIVILSPHTKIETDRFTVNANPSSRISFKEFGDFATSTEFRTDQELVTRVLEMGPKTTPVYEEELDHGAGIPLYHLTRHLKHPGIMVIGYSTMGLSAHFEMGAALKDIFRKSNKRIAIIASGDLSHRLSKEAPGGYSERGKEFDEKLIELLKKKDIGSILALDPHLIQEAGECGLRSIVMLLGMIGSMNFETKILSYESPFGVGYLIAKFDLA